MNKLLIITGAGASYDSVIDGSIKVNENYRPPLTKDLFLSAAGSVKSSHIFECLKNHPCAQYVGATYLKSRREGNQEKGLENFLLNLKNENTSIKKNFWSVPLYLHDLFYDMCDNFIECESGDPISTNYKFLLDEIRRSNKYSNIVWFNLNYDTLADFAIRASVKTNFTNMESYLNLETTDNKLKINYIKPHGSIGWYKVIDPSSVNVSLGIIKNSPERLPDDFEGILSEDICIKTRNEYRESSGIIYYPVISAPLGNYEPVCKYHISTVEKEMFDINDMLCIGFSALDEDVLRLIKNNIKSIKKLKIVNGDQKSGQDAFDNIRQYCKNVNIDYGDPVFVGGFSKFITVRTGIKQWANNDYS